MTTDPTSPRSRLQVLSNRLHSAYSRAASLLLTLLSHLRREPLPVLKADSYLRFLRSSGERGFSNLVFTHRIARSEFHERMQHTDYWQWVQSGDYHYFISRVLFLRMIREYSLFAGHQCVENYLKGYIRFCGHIPQQSHNLLSLLQDCSEVAPARHLFIHSDQAKVVAQRYDPFYELARYPVSFVRPRTGYAIWFPSDIQVLDYFVYRMRQILPSSGRSWDILVDGHYDLYQCQEQYPDFYRLFRVGNLNFGSSIDS